MDAQQAEGDRQLAAVGYPIRRPRSAIITLFTLVGVPSAWGQPQVELVLHFVQIGNADGGVGIDFRNPPYPSTTVGWYRLYSC